MCVGECDYVGSRIHTKIALFGVIDSRSCIIKHSSITPSFDNLLYFIRNHHHLVVRRTRPKCPNQPCVVQQKLVRKAITVLPEVERECRRNFKKLPGGYYPPGMRHWFVSTPPPIFLAPPGARGDSFSVRFSYASPGVSLCSFDLLSESSDTAERYEQKFQSYNGRRGKHKGRGRTSSAVRAVKPTIGLVGILR